MRMTAPMEAGLAVRDLARMRAFYETALGFAFVAEFRVPAEKAREAALCAEGYTVVRLQTPNGERLKLLATSGPPAVASTDEAFILGRPRASYLTFIVDDIAPVLQRALAAGARSLTGPHPVEVRPGIYLAFLHDPEGHVLELVSYDDIAAYRPDLQQGMTP